jgi:hypothetical protein
MSAPVDEQLVRRWVRQLHDYVRAATAHLSDPGQLQLVARHPTDPNANTIISRCEIGDVDRMVAAAVSAASQGYNVWIEGRTVKRGTTGRGTKRDETVWVFGLVIDYDGKGRAPCPETFSVQTSEGHAHLWYLTSLSPERAEMLGNRLRREAAADNDTGVITQPYRVPGTPNYPTPKKIATGRTTEPTFIWTTDGPTYSFEQLDAQLPSLPPQHLQSPVSDDVDDLSGRSRDEVYEHLRQLQQNGLKNALDNFLEPTGKLVPDRQRNVPDRSRQFRHACLTAFENDFTAAEVYRFILAKCPGGIVRKFLERSLSDFAREIEKHWRKHLEYESRRQQDRQLLGPFLAKSGAGSSPQLNQPVPPQAIRAE